MTSPLIHIVQKRYLKPQTPKCRVGDTVDVHCRIVEGDKERVQVFSGVVIAREGSGIDESITVRRIVGNEGVERKLPVHSPNVVALKVKRHGKVRRAKLFYLRKRVGKARKLREARVHQKSTATEPELAVSTT